MPIYDYSCKKCGVDFSSIQKSAEDSVKCPVCDSEEVQKKISSFNFGGFSSSGYSGFGG
ncbi:MAG: zinc ribbon domain-containing protein [Nitrospiraceae bacterium]|nr:zinc ribbon domain-containing protein [Nitrospiraceae bacterium]